MDYISILNTIHANSSALYQERVPLATKNNLKEVGTAIRSYQATTNEFLDGLVTRVAYVDVNTRRFKNPLAFLKRSGNPFGTTFEEIYVNPAVAVAFDGSETSDMLEVTKPDIKTIFHTRNRQDKYRVSISPEQLESAFISAAEFEAFYNSVIIDSMYNGDEIDEFMLMKECVSEGCKQNLVKVLELDYDGGKESNESFVKLVKTLSSMFTFPRTDNNGYNVSNAEGIEAGTITEAITWTPKANQVILIRADIDASTDVDVLAKAFNMDRADLLERKVVIDSFGDEDTLCLIADERMFVFKDNQYQVRRFDNGSNLTTNYWLHHWQTLSLSLFANGVAIKKKATA